MEGSRVKLAEKKMTTQLIKHRVFFFFFFFFKLDTYYTGKRNATPLLLKVRLD